MWYKPTMPVIALPDPKAQPLLRVIVEAIGRGRIREGEPRTFLSYSEALDLMGVPRRGPAGHHLQRSGLNALNEWTLQHQDLPKLAALIVNKKTRRPSSGFAESHGHADDPHWEQWWLSQANRAITYDWKPFLAPVQRYRRETPKHDGLRVREDEDAETPEYQNIIVISPPPARIRESRVTVSQVLSWLADGQSENEILRRHRELRSADIRASLAYAADREKRAVKSSFTARWTGKFTLPAPDPSDDRLSYLLERYERNRR